MKRFAIIIWVLLLTGTFLSAAPAKVRIKGTTAPSGILSKFMGIDRLSLKPETGSSEMVIPEVYCRHWLILTIGNEMSWIYLLPGEMLEVNAGNAEWQFFGDGAQINRYLYTWYRDFYKEKPNIMLQYTETYLFPGKKIDRPTTEMMASPEYLTWLSGLNRQAQQALKKARIDDREFVKKQAGRMYCAWVEMSVNTYSALQREGIVPQEARDFLKKTVFNEPMMLDYDGFGSILGSFFKLDERVNGISYPSADFLEVQAERIVLPELRERHILSELRLLLSNKLTYQLDQVVASVEKERFTDRGKSEFAELKEKCLALQAKDQRGTQARPCAWETPEGKIIRLADYRGKYLFIDFWGTHCGACKVEMPDRKKLEEYFKEAPIRFLSVCFGVAKERESWKEMSLKLPLPADYVFSDRAKNIGEKDWGANYEIPTIPRYMLFDPQGKLVMWDGRRPSDPLLRKQLEEILEN